MTVPHRWLVAVDGNDVTGSHKYLAPLLLAADPGARVSLTLERGVTIELALGAGWLTAAHLLVAIAGCNENLTTSRLGHPANDQTQKGEGLRAEAGPVVEVSCPSDSGFAL